MSEPRVVLETDRLLLREMSVERDLEPLSAHFADPETMRYYAITYDRREARNWIERPLLLMSDRDSGLWIFRYTGRE